MEIQLFVLLFLYKFDVIQVHTNIPNYVRIQIYHTTIFIWAPLVAEWLIFSALNRSSSHSCGFEPSTVHM